MVDGRSRPGIGGAGIATVGLGPEPVGADQHPELGELQGRLAGRSRQTCAHPVEGERAGIVPAALADGKRHPHHRRFLADLGKMRVRLADPPVEQRARLGEPATQHADLDEAPDTVAVTESPRRVDAGEETLCLVEAPERDEGVGGTGRQGRKLIGWGAEAGEFDGAGDGDRPGGRAGSAR